MTPFPGITVNIRGKDYVVPSLTYGEIKRFRAAGVFDAPTTDNVFLVIGDNDFLIAKTALLHNYPQLTDAELEDLTPKELRDLALAALQALFGIQPEEAPANPEA